MKPFHPMGAAIALACTLAGTASAAPGHTVPDTMAQRVVACAVCHGKEGVATPHGYFPRIAGKPAGYLYNQLINFRDGRRSNGVMSTLLENMTDDYLLEIAAHFASLDLPYPPPQPVAATPALQRGEALMHRGDPDRQVPSCVSCHGAKMTGVAPAIPGLVGLPRDYLLAQFGAWRAGKRHAADPDCMAQISQALSADDVGAVATYLSSRPVPPDSKPAPGPLAALPMDCGGLK